NGRGCLPGQVETDLVVREEAREGEAPQRDRLCGLRGDDRVEEEHQDDLDGGPDHEVASEAEGETTEAGPGPLDEGIGEAAGVEGVGFHGGGEKGLKGCMTGHDESGQAGDPANREEGGREADPEDEAVELDHR